MAESVTPRVHELKTWPEFFLPLWRGTKTFEVRFDDRQFAVGDMLHLREYSPTDKTYTGAEIHARVSYILVEHDGLKPGYVAMGLELKP